jgi:5'-phosphate synthase pdxT subunit
LKIGVLGIQGDIQEHLAVIKKLGHEALWIRDSDALKAVDALVMPGGESTTMTKLLKRFAIWEPLRKSINSGMPVFATCAGMILLSRGIENYPAQDTLGVLDVTIERNGYGRQVDSFEADLYVSYFGDGPFRAVFIRAPKIATTGKEVEVMACFGGTPVLVRERNIMAASFHPELTDDVRLQRYFLDMVGNSIEDATSRM